MYIVVFNLVTDLNALWQWFWEILTSMDPSDHPRMPLETWMLQWFFVEFPNFKLLIHELNCQLISFFWIVDSLPEFDSPTSPQYLESFFRLLAYIHGYPNALSEITRARKKNNAPIRWMGRSHIRFSNKSALTQLCLLLCWVSAKDNEFKIELKNSESQ